MGETKPTHPAQQLRQPHERAPSRRLGSPAHPSQHSCRPVVLWCSWQPAKSCVPCVLGPNASCVRVPFHLKRDYCPAVGAFVSGVCCFTSHQSSRPVVTNAGFAWGDTAGEPAAGRASAMLAADGPPAPGRRRLVCPECQETGMLTICGAIRSPALQTSLAQHKSQVLLMVAALFAAACLSVRPMY